MVKDEDKKLAVAMMRVAAEAQLSKARPSVDPALTAKELLHELQVHQIELEMQNETLQQAQSALEESRDRYVNLYEFAPVGYLSLTLDGLIEEINLTGTRLLQRERKKLLQRSFTALVVAEDQTRWTSLFMRLKASGAKASVELALQCGDGTLLQAQLDCDGSQSAKVGAGDTLLLVVLHDISARKAAEEEIKRYLTQLQSAFMSTVEVATVLSEMRDPYTAGHERRVGKLAAAIGAELGFDAQAQEGLRVAGFLHDIGKITIPAEILSKPGKLSALEFTLIQGHAQASFDVLKDVQFPWPVAQVALQHHERLDGGGYPQGLKGEAILFEARIMAVADVVEAMSSHRPYRAALGIEKALAEIERGRGSSYDPQVVDACLKLFRELDYVIAA